MAKNSIDTSAAIIVANLEKESKTSFKKLEKFEVKTEEDYTIAGDLLKQLKTFKKHAEQKESSIVDPIKQGLNEIKLLFKPFYSKVDATEAATKSAMLAYITKKQLEAAKIQEKFDKGEIKKVSTLMDKLAPTQVAAKGIRETKYVEIENENLIPREYLIPDMVKINQAMLKEGLKIKGCKIETRKGLAI